MPLELRPMTADDALSWARVRSIAYYGPTHDVLHSGRIRESSLRGVAEAHKQVMQQPDTWHWKVVDTDAAPSPDDPHDNGGRTIAVSVWAMENTASITRADQAPGFVPPELRLDALSSLLGPLRAAQKAIMGSAPPYLKLRSLATHPEYQGRGAAGLMLDWGLDKADREGLAVYLDATQQARPLYERRGFNVVRVIEWDREPWGGQGHDCHSCMLRAAASRRG